MNTIPKDNKTLFFKDFQKFHTSLFEDNFNKAPFSVKGKFSATKDLVSILNWFLLVVVVVVVFLIMVV